MEMLPAVDGNGRSHDTYCPDHSSRADVTIKNRNKKGKSRMEKEMQILNQIKMQIISQKDKLITMSDEIHDHPECGGEEIFAAELLTGYLESNDFSVERGIAKLPTAFRAVYRHGAGGVRIGLLCEYDALEGLGHGCGHHMQGAVCLGAAVALKNMGLQENFTIIVYGTPAEETFGGKVQMLKEGYFKDIDLALMVHGGPDTCTDIKCLALSSYRVVFHGKSAHAAIMPEKGRSALDGLLLAFQGMEFLREHVSTDVKMHYTIKELPGPENVIPARAAGHFTLRSYSREELNGVALRFKDLIKGESLMAGVTYEIKEESALDNKISVFFLNDLLIHNAELSGAAGIAAPREKTGSTDFGNVLH